MEYLSPRRDLVTNISSPPLADFATPPHGGNLLVAASFRHASPGKYKTIYIWGPRRDLHPQPMPSQGTALLLSYEDQNGEVRSRTSKAEADVIHGRSFLREVIRLADWPQYQ